MFVNRQVFFGLLAASALWGCNIAEMTGGTESDAKDKGSSTKKNVKSSDPEADGNSTDPVDKDSSLATLELKSGAEIDLAALSPFVNGSASDGLKSPQQKTASASAFKTSSASAVQAGAATQLKLTCTAKGSGIKGGTIFVELRKNTAVAETVVMPLEDCAKFRFELGKVESDGDYTINAQIFVKQGSDEFLAYAGASDTFVIAGGTTNAEPVCHLKKIGGGTIVIDPATAPNSPPDPNGAAPEACDGVNYALTKNRHEGGKVMCVPSCGQASVDAKRVAPRLAVPDRNLPQVAADVAEYCNVNKLDYLFAYEEVTLDQVCCVLKPEAPPAPAGCDLPNYAYVPNRHKGGAPQCVPSCGQAAVDAGRAQPRLALPNRAEPRIAAEVGEMCNINGLDYLFSWEEVVQGNVCCVLKPAAVPPPVDPCPAPNYASVPNRHLGGQITCSPSCGQAAVDAGRALPRLAAPNRDDPRIAAEIAEMCNINGLDYLFSFEEVKQGSVCCVAR